MPLISFTRLSLKEVPKETTSSSFSPMSSSIAAVVLGSIAGVAAKVVGVSLFALDQLLLGIGQGVPGGLGGLTLGIGVIGALLHIDGIDQVCHVLCGQSRQPPRRKPRCWQRQRSCRAGSSGAACGTAAAGQYTGAEGQSGQSGSCFVDVAFSHVLFVPFLFYRTVCIFAEQKVQERALSGKTKGAFLLAGRQQQKGPFQFFQAFRVQPIPRDLGACAPVPTAGRFPG